MKLKTLLFTLLLCKAFTSLAQADTLRVHFAINSTVLSAGDKKLIDSLVLNCYTVKSLTGYADYLGSKTGNQTLSERRAQAVQTYFKSLDPKFNVLAVGNGMLADSITGIIGNPDNRRVDIVAVRPVQVVPSAPKPTKQDSLNEVFRKKIQELDNIQIGEALQLSELNFYGGRHVLTRQALFYMDILLDYLQKHTDIKIEIQGHICCEFNLKDGYDYDSRDKHLSVNRAKVVYDYLADHGIKKNRMRYKGLGATKPKIYPEETAADKDANRRVEIVVTARSADTGEE
ncbi:OmpA family protein [Mucilaginibacter conchicola]|uniref:OmpA family protein n=1 Tax=Mucilaginibacter conchicola TaxID=2303333 RepID=A0A372NPW5_9SPHI|nr:OmpA family protein [Mucilaginibacter conchicola]RFZ90293.1 OmpA family protein [Mucilaginibacter conchicola]